MNFELYEVWAVEEDGHEQLLETTASRKQAFEFAKSSLIDDCKEVIIYRENDDGELQEVERLTS